MAQNTTFASFTDQETIEWLRHHMIVMHGYALALAQKAGLSGAEAAQLFVEPLLASASLLLSTTLQLPEQQAMQNAAVLALTYGEQQVSVERNSEVWLVKAQLSDNEGLTRYGASLDFHTQWLAEQLRLVCEPKSINCKVWLIDDKLHIQLSSYNVNSL